MFTQNAKIKTKVVIILVLSCALFAADSRRAFADTPKYERIVVLYPAVSPILKELGIDKEVVGVTKNDGIYNDAVRVGSHLKPNIEMINALEPQLIIAGSLRSFAADMKAMVKAEVLYYDPKTLDDILEQIRKLGALLNKTEKAENLVTALNQKLTALKPLKSKPRVIYEVMEEPLRVAGKSGIVNAIIEKAGAVNLIEISKNHTTLSIEEVIKLNPDFYIYQEGPMNKNPKDPKERYNLKSLTSAFVKVDEYEFARPGINSFDAVIKLNGIFSLKGVDNAASDK
ncbi:iron ABC transporter substrate-binding protein [Candidatus Magnetoovum chiemensis]|nr:iron ABC transporter substrate-binding protein [Candidatus Magnetoovum chiemensis]